MFQQAVNLAKKIDKAVERARYDAHKKWLLSLEVRPIIALPFHAMIELNLDKVFEEQGFTAAEEYVKQWIADLEAKHTQAAADLASEGRIEGIAAIADAYDKQNALRRS